MSRKEITLRHLADELGLTIQTVSKALRGRPGMSEETRSKVIRLARKLGYITKEQVDSLIVDRIAPYPYVQRRFVLIQNDGSQNHNRLLLKGLHERFWEIGHTVEPVLLPGELKAGDFGDWAESKGLSYAEGIFIAPRLSVHSLEEKLLRLPVPRILLNYPSPESKVDCVIWDVYEAIYQSVRHLSRMGHSRVMYVGDIESQRGFILRWQAFAEAMREAGNEVRPEEHAIVRQPADDWLRRFEAAYRRYRPTAILCGIDEETAPVYYSLLKMGVRIPQDCSLIALLNEQTEHLPLLTRPLLLIREAGYRAADRMLWRIANPHLPYEEIRLRGDFYAGSTVLKRLE
ncbi:LacI family transcriptional regulator [Paenibacillus hemerocallicola]|uniref:LacI family transcriptional regulator n=1 Tax=Paenibacillus hemerocallicola TaxID=1172614 RepID=A0A5C4T3Y3_9BACL|nr:LacI family DNA-binding transcriptional regulator [Paenibacillus hemerocallicola]TNJ63007.1 LacI family transcriptional regulator [Paenibacillus hemerocallicola]